MKRTIFLLGLFIFLSQVVSAQWVSNYGGHSYGDNNFASAKGLAAAADVNGNCFVTGFCHDLITGDDIITIKYSPQGDTLWTRTYNGSGNLDDQGTAIACDAVGNVYVTGYANISGDSTDIVTIKYSPNGTQQWVATPYNGTGNADDKAFGIAVDALSNIYIAGYCTSAGNNIDIVTIKYDSSGTQQWASVFNGPDGLTDKAFGMVIDALSNVYVTGYSQSNASGNDIIVIKYSPQGDTLWTRAHNGISNGDDQGKCIKVDGLGNVYAAGYITAAPDTTNCILLKYTSSGTQSWASTYNNDGSGSVNKAFGIAVDAVSGSIYITGEAGLSGNTDYVTIKYGSSGTQMWASSYNGTGNGNDKSNAIAEVNGNVVVTGATVGSTNTADYCTVVYSGTTGTALDTTIYSMSSTSVDVATALAVSPTGDVYVTGSSEILINGPVSLSYISTQKIHIGEKKENTQQIPATYTLYQNYPNPFNPTTTIKFDIIKASKVKLAVYDILGREVTVLVNEFKGAGKYEAVFTSNNISSGIYFYVLTADGFRDVKKMTLVK